MKGNLMLFLIKKFFSYKKLYAYFECILTVNKYYFVLHEHNEIFECEIPILNSWLMQKRSEK